MTNNIDFRNKKEENLLRSFFLSHCTNIQIHTNKVKKRPTEKSIMIVDIVKMKARILLPRFMSIYDIVDGKGGGEKTMNRKKDSSDMPTMTLVKQQTKSLLSQYTKFKYKRIRKGSSVCLF